MRVLKLLTMLAGLALPLSSLPTQAADWDDGQILTTQEKLKGKRVGYVPISMSIDLTQAWIEGIRRDAERYGYEIITRDPNWNVQTGAQAINQLIGEGVDLLIIHSLDAQSYAKPIERARAAGIPVVQINLKSLANSEAYVGVNYYEIYIKAAEAMVGMCGKDSGNNGKIALVQGTLTTSGSIAGRQALSDYFADHPDIQIVAEQAADWDATKAQAVTSTILKQNPDLCGIIGFWEVMDMGTAAAIKEAGLQGKVKLITTGGGEQRSNCDNVANGNFTMDLSYDARGQARDLATVVSALLQSKDTTTATIAVGVYTPIKVVTKDNVNANVCWKLEDVQKYGP